MRGMTGSKRSVRNGTAVPTVMLRRFIKLTRNNLDGVQTCDRLVGLAGTRGCNRKTPGAIVDGPKAHRARTGNVGREPSPTDPNDS